MDSSPKRYQLPLKQTLVLGVIGLVILAVLLRPTDSTPIAIKPQVTFIQGVELKFGPSKRFFPPIGSYVPDETAILLAKNETGDWYKVKGLNGEGWVPAESVTISGDLSQLPMEIGIPTPVNTPPPMPTPTSPFLSNANLVLGNVFFEPSLPLQCGQSVGLKIDVANQGYEATTTSGIIMINDTWKGAEQTSTQGTFPVIEPGQTFTVTDISLTVPCDKLNVDHKIIVIVNPDDNVLEVTAVDNSREYIYVLQDR